MVIIFHRKLNDLESDVWLEYDQQMESACQEQILYYMSKQSYMKIACLKPAFNMPITNDI